MQHSGVFLLLLSSFHFTISYCDQEPVKEQERVTLPQYSEANKRNHSDKSGNHGKSDTDPRFQDILEKGKVHDS